jgi:hypothetical protein
MDAFVECMEGCDCPSGPSCGNGRLEPGEDCELDADCQSGQECASCRCVGTGDVRITLTWGTIDDLDLHVIDPLGEEIYYRNLFSTSGGALDVDANAACGSPTTNAVENVFWSAGGAPAGTYTVLVDYWESCSGVAEIPFVVRTLVDGIERPFTGTAFTPDRCDACSSGGCSSCAAITTFTR